jgi:DNA-directed RNA polymerase specialized sigma24 family protein
MGAMPSLAENIASHLPQLRRFARLLTGSQQAGDAAVSRMLQAIVADPGAYPEKPGRVEVYQLFLKTLAAIPEEAAPHGASIGQTAARSLAAMTPQARQAFLLVSVEELVPREAAEVLEVSQRRAEELLNQASEEIARQIATDVLIIEDEPLIALDLQRMLEGVTSIARTHDDAVEAASSNKPGLVLADIRLADGSSGLEAVNDILASFSVPVVFITAYPDKLMTGERPEPTFLITKPFREDAVKAVVSQVLFFDQQARRRHKGLAS